MDATAWEKASSLWDLMAVIQGRVSDRKLRLFALACLRQHDERIRDHRCREGLRVLERMAEERVPRREMESTLAAFEQFADVYGRPLPGVNPDDRLAAQALEMLLTEPLSVDEVYRATGLLRTGRSSTRARMRLLREVPGNPFRPAAPVDPAWLDWEHGLVRHLAEVAYDGRAYDRLPILGDALEDAGCRDAELLAHLRGGGPHLLGCWALDAVLGKS